MRWLVVACAGALVVVNLSCQSCPDGNAGNSLFCHSADCASGESVCGGACANLQSDRDNCGVCGHACGDGLVCARGDCIEGCDNGLPRCNGACVDTSTDHDNCGNCNVACNADQTCNGGTCGCAATDLVCGTVCTDPLTDEGHCGATGDCLGSNAGTQCGANEACSGGLCLSTRIYRGSLPATTGRWTLQAAVGLTGANAECDVQFPGSQVCSSDKLSMAAVKGELLGAKDVAGVDVTEWWIDDPASDPLHRCQDATKENVPWSYATAHLGNVGKFVSLSNGQISQVVTGSIADSTGLCNTARFIACCSIMTAP